MTKWRFTVCVQNKHLKEVCRLMKCLDCGFGEVFVENIMEFTSNKEDLTIEKLKETIIAAYKSEDAEVFKIEGGIIE